MIRKLIPFIVKLLDTSNTRSVMRFVTILAMITTCLYILGIFITNDVILIINTWSQYHHIIGFKVLNYFVIDWVGIASFIGATLVSKSVQSFAENRNNN